MERLVVADTDVVIDFFADAPPAAAAVAILLEKGRLALASVSVFELYAGVTGAARLKQIDAFISGVEVLSFGAVEAAYAARIYTSLKAKGRLIGNQDIMIAATCLSRSLELLTRNAAHFSLVPGLKLQKMGTQNTSFLLA